MKNPNPLFNFKKTSYAIFGAVVLIVFTIGCSTSDNSNNLPTAAGFNTLKTQALNSLTQHFQFNTADGTAHFFSPKGVRLFIDPNTLTLNGTPVTGQIDLEYIEIFDGGNMVVTGKHTMGKMPDGNHSMLISGGEFYINATKDGQQLQLNGALNLQVPTTLTNGNNGGNPNMTLWNLAQNDSVWVPAAIDATGNNFVTIVPSPTGINPTVYRTYVGNFGWINLDCFSSYTGPKTTILASLPKGYNNLNAAIYLHYDGKGNALANLDTYNSATGLFSDHYGQIPIGLNCHIIFVTEENGKSRYAIKSATISAGAIYNFDLSETTVGTQAQLTATINALP